MLKKGRRRQPGGSQTPAPPKARPRTAPYSFCNVFHLPPGLGHRAMNVVMAYLLKRLQLLGDQCEKIVPLVIRNFPGFSADDGDVFRVDLHHGIT
jgi:hypothetical protein